MPILLLWLLNLQHHLQLTRRRAAELTLPDLPSRLYPMEVITGESKRLMTIVQKVLILLLTPEILLLKLTQQLHLLQVLLQLLHQPMTQLRPGVGLPQATVDRDLQLMLTVFNGAPIHLSLDVEAIPALPRLIALPTLPDWLTEPGILKLKLLML